MPSSGGERNTPRLELTLSSSLSTKTSSLESLSSVQLRGDLSSATVPKNQNLKERHKQQRRITAPRGSLRPPGTEQQQQQQQRKEKHQSSNNDPIFSLLDGGVASLYSSSSYSVSSSTSASRDYYRRVLGKEQNHPHRHSDDDFEAEESVPTFAPFVHVPRTVPSPSPKQQPKQPRDPSPLPYDSGIGSGWNSDNNGGTGSNTPQQPHEGATATTTANTNAIVMFGFVAGLTVLMLGIFLILVIPPFIRYIRRKFPVSQTKINRRYETIEGWLISKRVRRHDVLCEHVCRHYRSKGGDKRTEYMRKSTSPHKTTKAELDCAKNKSTTAKEHLQHTLSYDTHETVQSSEVGDDGIDVEAGSVSTRTSNSSSSSNRSSTRSDSCGISAVLNTSTTSVVSTTSAAQECPICMEPFKVNEIVSWSPNESCDHVFHHECIKEWLLRHAECPFCREIYLPIDDRRNLYNSGESNGNDNDTDDNVRRQEQRENGNTNNRRNNQHYKQTKQQLMDLSQKHLDRAISTYYCIRDGLISLDRKHKILEKEDEGDNNHGDDDAMYSSEHASREELVMLREVTRCKVKRQDLVDRRGTRCGGNDSSTTATNTSERDKQQQPQQQQEDREEAAEDEGRDDEESASSNSIRLNIANNDSSMFEPINNSDDDDDYDDDDGDHNLNDMAVANG